MTFDVRRDIFFAIEVDARNQVPPLRPDCCLGGAEFCMTTSLVTAHRSNGDAIFADFYTKEARMEKPA